MGENKEVFGDELIILAEIVEKLEKSYICKDITEIKLTVDKEKFDYLSQNLNSQNKDKLIVGIGNINFTFLKK